MSLWVLKLLLACGSTACSLLIFAFGLWVTARRPADDRDQFIRKLPPPSQPMAVREAQLRVLVRKEMIRVVKIDGVIAVVSVVVGMSLAASEQAPIGVGIAAGAFFWVPLVVFHPIFGGFILIARYRSVQLRLRNDVVWHGSGGQPPVAPNDI